MINMQGLVAMIRNAENTAASAVNALGPNSTAGDLTNANLLMNKFNMIGTLVSAVIKSESETKAAPIRAISP